MTIAEQMETSEIVELRQLLQMKSCRLLFDYMGNYLTYKATSKQEEALEIKGMAKLLHAVKTLEPTLTDVLKNRH
jgi:hypothetical protein